MKTITKRTIFGRALLYAVAVLAAVLTSITARAQNNLYVSISGDGSNSGGSIFEYTPDGTQTTFASGLSRPRGLAFDNGGNLFVATTTANPGGHLSGKIWKFPPLGPETVLGNVAQSFVQDVATDSAGNVFVGAVILNNPHSPGTIYKFAADGTRSIFGSVPGLFGLAFDSAGNLFAAALNDQTIYKFTPEGTRSIFVSSSAFTATQFPIGLAFDSADNLFVSTVGNSTEGGAEGDVILKFTPGGAESTFATDLGNPKGLTFDAQGNLFVVLFQRFTGAVLKFTPDGTETIFASGLPRSQYVAFGPAR